MAKKGKVTNPFYVLLVIAGVLFAITACGYGVMTIKLTNPESMAQQTTELSHNNFVDFFEKHGFTLMLVELIVLGIGTFAAIGTDDYWEQRGAKQAKLSEPPQESTPKSDSSLLP